MRQRFDFETLAPGAEDAISRLDELIASSGLEPGLIDLIKVRASQINGCVYCIDMHVKEARSRGESDQRLHGLGVWRHAPWFSRRERAALAWTEAITRLDGGDVSDEVFAETCAHFSQAEIAILLAATIAINAWNRVAISQRLASRLGVGPLSEVAV